MLGLCNNNHLENGLEIYTKTVLTCWSYICPPWCELNGRNNGMLQKTCIRILVWSLFLSCLICNCWLPRCLSTLERGGVTLMFQTMRCYTAIKRTKLNEIKISYRKQGVTGVRQIFTLYYFMYKVQKQANIETGGRCRLHGELLVVNSCLEKGSHFLQWCSHWKVVHTHAHVSGSA